MALKLGMDPNLLRFLPGHQTATKGPGLVQQGYTVVEVIQDQPSGSAQQQTGSSQPMLLQSGTVQQPIIIDSGVVQQQQLLTSSQGLTQHSQSQFQVQDLTQQSLSQFQELPREFVTVPRSRTTIGAIPESERDYSKYVYCNRCPHKYTSHSELLRHQRNSCLKPRKEYICPICLQDYFQKVSIREHYYQEHLKKHLYKCKKCGKGFYFKSKRSIHKSSCPNKEEPDTFTDTVRDPELENVRFLAV